MFPFVLIAAAVGGYLWYRKRHATPSSTPSTAQPVAPTCEVTFTVASVKTPANAQKVMAWVLKWGTQGSALARDAATDLMKSMAPQCTWTPTTVATIHRADGTVTTWTDIMATLGNKTVSQAQQEIGNQIFGSEPQ